jgi:hypothetical protein
MLGEGDVTALLFRRELRILLSSIFGEKNPFGFAIFSWTELRLCFSRIDGTLRQLVTLFLAGGHNVKVCLLQAVKVWPLQGPNPHKWRA